MFVSHLFVIIARKFSIGLKSGDLTGQGILTTLCIFNHSFTVTVVNGSVIHGNINGLLRWDEDGPDCWEHHILQCLNIMAGSKTLLYDGQLAWITGCHPSPKPCCYSSVPAGKLDVLRSIMICERLHASMIWCHYKPLICAITCSGRPPIPLRGPSTKLLRPSNKTSLPVP